MGLLLGLTGLSVPALAQDTSAAGDTILVFHATGSMWAQIDGVPKITAAPSGKTGAAQAAPAKQEPVPEPATQPRAVATGMATLEATDQRGGPVIKNDLVWTVRHGASGDVLHESDAGGRIVVELPRGVHDVSVRRVSDGATAEGEIKLDGDRGTLSLPIVVELNASLTVPESAAAGSKVRIVWTGPDETDDYISVGPANAAGNGHANYTRTRDGNPLQLLMPAEAGTYEVRYVSRKTHDVLARKSIAVGEITAGLEVPVKAPAGSTISVAWTGPDYHDDYISVAKLDAAGNKYINYTRTSSGNPLKLLIPAEPGSYEVRYVQRQSHKILASEKIDATAVAASLKLPASAAVGSKIAVEWTGPDYRDDYISIAKIDSPGGSSLDYKRTRDGSPAEIKLPDEIGTYEVRYVQRQDHRILASKKVSVTD